jgi:uncharacterized protein with GYD domain
MPKFLILASYTAEGGRGIQKEGGSSRRDAVAKMTQALGGKLESFYFTFGESDVVAVVDYPDTTTALATSVAINASGAVRASVTPLITPEDMDAACKKSVGYRAPGS